MTFPPHMSLFISTLILGSFMSLSANHWLFIWMGLELNLLSFIPLICSTTHTQESEAAVKYFLAQAFGSGLLLLGSINMYWTPQLLMNSQPLSWFLLMGLLVKLGMPPCHFWFPLVTASLSWPMVLVLLTWQKIVPMMLLFYIFFNFTPKIMILILVSGALIGGLGGLNQSQLRPILAYSSIGHMTWMISGSMASLSASLFYLLIYILISSALIIMMWNYSMPLSSLLDNLSSTPPIFLFSILILLLSLGGLPPLLGFIPKWLTLQALTQINIMIPLILIMGSVLNLIYYLNVVFISSMSLNKPSILTSNKGPHRISSLFMGTTLLGAAPLSLMLT
uniref:NADH-ubiquinone oxidoreductase chain 2 n=1 Tax=Aphrodita australis TaxID=2715517 RepID=A0A6G7IXS7_9ANNE|nr:NADH dehydrogenase subunit 2 [Aphrodita australis]QII43124.1 NADH dehydrogenase subunit 2 [Aphrodita australis]